MLYDPASLDNDEQRKVQPASRRVWKGMKLLQCCLGCRSICQTTREERYQRIFGGRVVGCPSAKSKAHERAKEELAKLEEADIFVTRFRIGSAYAKVSFAVVVYASYSCPQRLRWRSE